MPLGRFAKAKAAHWRSAALAKARQTIKTAIEAKTVELMTESANRVKGEIAEAVFGEDADILDERAIVDALVEQLAGYDWTEILNLVSAEVPAGNC